MRRQQNLPVFQIIESPIPGDPLAPLRIEENRQKALQLVALHDQNEDQPVRRLSFAELANQLSLPSAFKAYRINENGELVEI